MAVAVVCPGGTATLNNAFTFAPPSITAVLPIAAPPTAEVIITGSGFQNGATVAFGGIPSPTVTFVDASTLRAVVPTLAAGPAVVVVTNPDTQSAVFNGFTVLGLSAIPALSQRWLLTLIVILAIAGAVALRARGV